MDVKEFLTKAGLRRPNRSEPRVQDARSRAVDPRWEVLRRRSWRCLACGEEHRGIFDLGATKPDFWQGSEEQEPNSNIVGATHCLTEDFCVLENEHFFVRCVLRMPLIGAGAADFGFGVWSTLARKNFEKYLETFDGGDQDGLGPWFGWFSNRLKGYPDTLNLKCQVHPVSGRQRPWVELESGEHPLARDATEGITYDRLMEIYAAYGHQVGTG